MSVMVVTSLGEIVIDLFTDRCPLTTKNFLKLCKIKYYNGCLFHTIQKDFTAQTGDPTGTGSGGDSIYKFLYGEQARFFHDEIHPDVKHSKMGTVAMASAGENLNASQFYITLRDDLDYLDEKHTVFGEIAEGHDTLMRINEAYVDEKGRPFKNIRIKHTYVLDDPFEDPPQLSELIPDASPGGKPKEEVDDEVRLEDDWVPMDEQLDPDDLEEVIRTKEAHSRAVVLESIGDIPDADVKPPENVLFVCKLNPVTEDEDLHTIFSRFGTVTSAEVIRDFKTGDSLCYAFIEFADNDACERAYFKMDNALIDDRRIHVDFSQSVSKLWNQFRRKGSQQGKGCFKCGALDHIAKYCTGDSTVPQQQKYVLKDSNQQRGGGKNASYDMVFDEDTEGSPQQEKRRRGHEEDDRTKRHKSERDRDTSDRHRHGGRGDDRNYRENRDRGHKNDRDNRESRDCGRREERDQGERRDDGEYKKRTSDIDKRDKRDGPSEWKRSSKVDDGDYRKRTSDIDKWEKRDDPSERKRSSEIYDGEYRKRTADINKREKRDDPSERKRSSEIDDGEYRKRTADIDKREKRDDPSERNRGSEIGDGGRSRREERGRISSKGHDDQHDEKKRKERGDDLSHRRDSDSDVRGRRKERDSGRSLRDYDDRDRRRGGRR